ncbi:MAG: phosphate acyltransferase PlsX [Desulfonatronovibrionaceae bacterium]
MTDSRNRPRLAVDAMGGDHGPEVVIPGALEAARKDDLALLLVGDRDKVYAVLSGQDSKGLDVEVAHAPEVVGMSEKPSEALRRRRETSIQTAFKKVRAGEAQGVVSAGNSGATLGCGMFILGRVKGIERPALASILPTEKDPVILIDVGANVDCKPYHLVQFGIMADVLAKDVLHIKNPRVGLLSIGEEEGKGNNQVREAARLLTMSSLNFRGNVEGRDMFKGDLDIFVCDGFVGNIALKLMEGLALSLTHMLKTEVKKSLQARLGFLIGSRALKNFSRRIDYAEYGGAPLLGLKGITIVCHGSSNPKAICNAVRMAGTFVTNKAKEHMERGIATHQELKILGKKALPDGSGENG